MRGVERLAALNVEWLEGRADDYPLYGAEPDPETVPLIPMLVAMNRAGYATTFSQPGELGDNWNQRAAVEGYCEEATASKLVQLTIDGDLIVLAYGPGEESLLQLPVTTAGGRVHTIIGQVADPLDDMPDVEPGIVIGLVSAWTVAVIDPVWGRDDLLWPAVVDALGREASHPPRLGPDGSGI